MLISKSFAYRVLSTRDPWLSCRNGDRVLPQTITLDVFAAQNIPKNSVHDPGAAGSTLDRAWALYMPLGTQVRTVPYSTRTLLSRHFTCEIFRPKPYLYFRSRKDCYYTMYIKNYEPCKTQMIPVLAIDYRPAQARSVGGRSLD